MKTCPKCQNQSPDTAVACVRCGTVLDDSVIARAQGPAGARVATVVEGAEPLRPSPPPPPAIRPSPPPPPLPQPAVRPSPPPPIPQPSPAPPVPQAGPPPARRGQTVYAPSPAPGVNGPPAGVVAKRKVIGVLVTYSWNPEGQMYPVREGRNLIGRGEECDIRVMEDPAMSQVNSHITFRQNLVLGDMVSMGGTDLNGEAVEEQFRPLGNYAQIRTGSTVWLFVVVDPALAGRQS